MYFTLCHVSGDNLGLNTILGFIKSLNCSYCCRLCYMSKDEIHKSTVQKDSLLRNFENYEQHSIDKSYGIVENCIFNNVVDFHVVKNVSIDPMHDLLEGICRYDIAKILNNLMYEEKAFSVEILNDRIKHFIPPSYDKNISTIKSESINNGIIILSTSEMHYLILYLGLFVGDLVSTKNLIWKLYLMLRKITYTSMLESINNNNIKLFETLIPKYLKSYIKLFKCSLKVKHHYLLHYGKIIREFGPTKNFSTMRFEAKHKELKEYSKIITSRKCPSYSLALKNQMKLYHRFICNKGCSTRLSHGPFSSKIHFLSDYDDFKFLLQASFEDCYSVSWVRLYGTRYEVSNVINKQTYDEPAFGNIKYIIIDKFKNVFFLYYQLTIVSYYEHYGAFNIKETKNWGLIAQNNLIDYKIFNVHVMSDSKLYVPSF